MPNWRWSSACASRRQAGWPTRTPGSTGCWPPSPRTHRSARWPGGYAPRCGQGSAPGGWNGNDATMVSCAQTAAKNILFARCNSYYLANTHDKSEDVIVADVQTVVEVEAPFPAWIFIIVGIDVLVVAGIAVWTFFLLKKPKRVGAGGQ